jgi:nitrogen fixation/metabolism regulation signal transduction histidine kinase
MERGSHPTAAQKAPTPSLTTRTVGLGLGLCVSRKIVEVHQGRLAIVGPASGKPGLVRLSLPLQPAANPNN